MSTVTTEPVVEEITEEIPELTKSEKITRTLKWIAVPVFSFLGAAAATAVLTSLQREAEAATKTEDAELAGLDSEGYISDEDLDAEIND